MSVPSLAEPDVTASNILAKVEELRLYAYWHHADDGLDSQPLRSLLRSEYT